MWPDVLQSERRLNAALRAFANREPPLAEALAERTYPGGPTPFSIAREGRVRQKVIGEKSRAEFEAMVAPLLDEQATTAALK